MDFSTISKILEMLSNSQSEIENRVARKKVCTLKSFWFSGIQTFLYPWKWCHKRYFQPRACSDLFTGLRQKKMTIIPPVNWKFPYTKRDYDGPSSGWLQDVWGYQMDQVLVCEVELEIPEYTEGEEMRDTISIGWKRHCAIRYLYRKKMLAWYWGCMEDDKIRQKIRWYGNIKR